MIFLIVTHVPHKYINGDYFAYGPYVREMNLWIKDIDKVVIIGPLEKDIPSDAIELAYQHVNIDFIPVHSFNLLGIRSAINTVFKIPGIIIHTYKAMCKADHIHLRCPGNMGLLGCIVQGLFPRKLKTAKYAGNWDPSSNQPLSYRLQQWILDNTFLTKKMQVLVYGHWPGSSKNILPFFTATYKEADRVACSPREPRGHIKLIFVGSLSKGKKPLISCEVVRQLLVLGITVTLDLFGEGEERKILEEFISTNNLENSIYLHGNQPGEVIKEAYRQSHFLVFISESEGWPKAVAEAMWWSCLPVTTRVSCVPEMVGFGERGELVSPDSTAIALRIKHFINQPNEYNSKCYAAMEWSRQYTLERFEKEIKILIQQ